jgi:sulfotransferase
MDNGIHFISGLPRAGSTLLSAILLQNPKLHAGITSPTGALIAGALRDMSQGNESGLFIDDTQRETVLRGLFDNLYHAIHPHQTVFDTNRSWCSRLHVIAELFPSAKIICCVRHVPWIIDSIERLIRRNRWELSKIFNFEPGGTVYSRAETLGGPNGLVGYARNALKQAMLSDEADRLLLLPYETLTREPARAIAAVYEFTGLAPFAHDFENVVFDAREFDARLGTPGLHTVRPSVTPTERQSILPPDLWRRIESDSFWTDQSFNRRNVRIVRGSNQRDW